jgi:class 3 adenylate cyclase
MRNVSVVAINFIGMHAAVQGRPADHLRRVLNTLTAAVLAEASEARGVMDAFHGDHFTVTFNCVAPCAMHASRAAGAAIAIGRKVFAARDVKALLEQEPVQQLPQLSFDHNHGVGTAPASAMSNTVSILKLSAGLASGPARLGDLGCTDAKRFMTVGPVFPAAFALEHVVRRHPHEAQWTPTPDNAYRIAVPAGLLEEFRTGYVCECIDIAALPIVPLSLEQALARQFGSPRDATRAPSRAVPHAVAQVVRERAGRRGAGTDDGEWMYVVGDDKEAGAGSAAGGTHSAAADRQRVSEALYRVGEWAQRRWLSAAATAAAAVPPGRSYHACSGSSEFTLADPLEGMTVDAVTAVLQEVAPDLGNVADPAMHASVTAVVARWLRLQRSHDHV